MIENLKKCMVCPHKCKANRLIGKLGNCKGGSKVKIALVSLHKYEEPCISGENGSGTIFFSNCNLQCKFCQNFDISQKCIGKEIEIEELADLFLFQQNRGAHNINLVSPTIYVYQIIEALDIAKSRGLKIPIIYNSNGYENINTLKLLKGYVDVYLPDFKYYYNDLAYRCSGVKNYFENTSKAILEMQNQVGGVLLSSNGLIKKGLIIRHLILPNNIENSKKVLKWINENIDKSVFVSIMAQYFPTYLTKGDKEFGRKISKTEYKEIENYLFSLEIENGYMQDLGKHEEEYVPTFYKNNSIIE